MEGWVLAIKSKEGQNMGDSGQKGLLEGCRVHPLEFEAEILKWGY